ncbi:MAG: hypothetical protein ACJA2W_002935 [Planctomycetota bacterium]|jgi:hypothetical protein
MRPNQPTLSRGTLRATAACFLALAVSCHSHDDDASGITMGPPIGSNGDFFFSGGEGLVQRGESFDCVAQISNGSIANIQTWNIVAGSQFGGSLANIGGNEMVRFVAGAPGFYAIEAMDDSGRVGTYGFNVANDGADLMVVDVIAGDDTMPVAASLATSGNVDLFIAERIGGSAAPQVIALANRAGDRLASQTLPYKIQDMAADDAGNLTVIRNEVTLTAALVRLDRDFNESATFSAPDLGTGAWREIVAMTRDGETLVPVDLNGGSLLRLNADGSPAGGTPELSLLALGVPFADVVDVATDMDGAVYVASETQIARVSIDGSIDTVYWQPEAQTAIRGVATDEDGVLFVSLQDADGGQCGSIRKLDWTGTEFRRIIEFSDGTEFAARKILDPVSLGVYSDGAWRLYDDIVTLNPAFERSAWILASEPQITE